MPDHAERFLRTHAFIDLAVHNEGEHCHVSYTLEDAGRAVLGCTVEYGDGCPWFGFGWATMPSIGETVWRSGLTEN